MPEKMIDIEIFRYNPSKDNSPYYKLYKVPLTVATKATVQNLLLYIYENIDSTLSFRNYKCNQGVCTSCLVKLNGQSVRSCCTFINVNEKVRIEPLNDLKVIKDLVTSF
ncbi:MAG: hypothetical protein GXY91_11325 [Clostridia bacterium]|nr:hypothetical protein [Clostridia bacterium]